MKTLKQAVRLRQSVFDADRRDTVLDLTDLLEGRIDPAGFFQENFLTGGMESLFQQAFRRFSGRSANGVVKLTQAMGGGSHKAPLFTVSWPTGEFGGMGLEGAVKLGFRKELAAVDDPAERKKLFEYMVARAYERGSALNTATHFEIDDVIDPADSRAWVTSLLRSVSPPAARKHKKRPCVDVW